MSVVGNVAARLAEAVDRLPVEVAKTVADQLDQVVELVEAVAVGTGSQALANAAAAFTHARDAAYDLVRELHAVAEDVHAYREVLGFHTDTASVQAGQPAVPAGPNRPASPEQLLAELPVRGPETRPAACGWTNTAPGTS